MARVSNTSIYRRRIAQLLDAYISTRDAAPIAAYLLEHIRAEGTNTWLASAFAREVGARADAKPAHLWRLCLLLIEAHCRRPDPSSAEVWLACFGIEGMTAITLHSRGRTASLLGLLRGLVQRPEEPIQGCVAAAIQRLVEAQGCEAIVALERWLTPGDWAAMQAIASGLARARLSHHKQAARMALTMHERILTLMTAAPERGSNDYLALRDRLGHSLSLVVRALPHDGLSTIRGLIDSHDADLLWIARDSLRRIGSPS